MTTDPTDPSEPTSPEGQALQPRRFMHLRWDLDKTYLRTEFDTVKDLIRTFRQKAEDKVAVAGASALLRALLDPRERSHRRVTFISGSPRQMRKVLTAKLALDGVEPDMFILKPNLENLLRGRFRAIRGQVGYKLKALLLSHMAAEHVDEYLFGDDAEQDAFIYSVYADILAGRIDAVSLAAILSTCKVYRGDVDEIMAYHRQLFGSGEVVRRIFIHLERRSPLDRFAGYGARVVAIYNYFQGAAVLFEAGALEPRGLLAVTEAMESDGYTPERLANSLQDLMRRGVLHFGTIERMSRELAAAESTMGRPVPRFLHAFEDAIGSLENLQRPGPRWESEINYLGIYHEARFRRQQHRFLGIRLLD
ncbi:phosphatase domain-containing protein [Nannocystis pusilla]|uniref:phosphatase domain-containing protein n=1 Tax=Nannocystis pusilla TaxID=889268 RepID=UPI003DA5A76F